MGFIDTLGWFLFLWGDDLLKIMVAVSGLDFGVMQCFASFRKGTFS